ncbi:hypothetical protein BSIN_1699 [Burkholderia singularis]|uniref:Uncharacterized protein n=1 Tax=Burkholderia singularis TaxID=1503053 RepID=A0A238GZJ5_9BURK|nr:hypothetical protein BSIN_1699 [Burkholderia singularis]
MAVGRHSISCSSVQGITSAFVSRMVRLRTPLIELSRVSRQLGFPNGPL